MTNEEWEFYIKKCKVPQEYQQIVKKYRKCFGQHTKEIGKIPGIKFKVELERIANSQNGKWIDPPPFHTEPYKQKGNDQEEIERQLNEQLEAGVVIPSKNPGPYQASCTVVLKKADPITGERAKRVAIDYTGLNANTKARNYPIPNIKRIIERSAQLVFRSDRFNFRQCKILSKWFKSFFVIYSPSNHSIFSVFFLF